MNETLKLLSVLSILCLSSCGSDVVVDIDPDFQVYVDRFIAEAADRGTTIDFSDTGLDLIYTNSGRQDLSGFCSLGEYHIEIDRTDWNALSERGRERLIFHELGHCELNRRHRNEILNNGDWASIMRGSPIPTGKSFFIHYYGSRRSYYLDELFDESTPSPEWSNRNSDYDIGPRTEVWCIEEVEEFSRSIPIDARDMFDIEVVIDRRQALDFFGFTFGGTEFLDNLAILYTGRGELVMQSSDNYWGLITNTDFYSDLLSEDISKITLRRLDDRYELFINEEYIYYLDYLSPGGSIVQSLTLNQPLPLFKSVKVYSY